MTAHPSTHIAPELANPVALPDGKGNATMLGVETLDAIRDAIEASGTSRYQLARESGVAESVLSRFKSRETGLSVGTIETLADALGLEILVRPKRRRRKGR